MTIERNRWEPDTCDCQLEYIWDDSVPESQRVTSVSVVNRSCNAHKNLLPNQLIVYNTVLDENNKKNTSLQIALDNATAQLADTITNPDNSKMNVLKPSIFYSYSLSGTAPNRVLNVSFQGVTLTSAQKNKIQSVLDSRFGTGVVVIS